MTAANSAEFSASVFTRRLATAPDLLDLQRRFPERYPYLLESVAHEREHARYDILFAFPQTRLLAYPNRVVYDGIVYAHDTFLNAFARAWRETATATDAANDALPFHGGWFIYLSYELAGEIEPRLRLPQSDAIIACAVRIPAAVVHDHLRNETSVICEAAYRETLFSNVLADCAAVHPRTATTPSGLLPLLSLEEEPPEIYLDHIARVQAYIRAGDVFQVNLSRQWHARLQHAEDPADIYARLRASNPAPFAGIARCGDMTIISSSPERLVQVRNGHVRTRPIAGTHPRGADVAEDTALAQGLLRHPKERAEHIMLIDLERNDLGRICEIGSVQVRELMTLESYRYVHHIVSEVAGRLRPGLTPIDVIRAVFPGGTITGCPKVRCMEIIAELEQAPRGPYTGAMGYINRDGSMDLNILIRTLTQRGRDIVFRAGGGIVADSNPERELNETRAKARGLQKIFRDA